jgi:hypothetical protein
MEDATYLRGAHEDEIDLLLFEEISHRGLVEEVELRAASENEIAKPIGA